MAYEIKEGTFSLFQNETDNPKAPRMKGKGKLNGVLYEFAVWTQESDNAGKYFSGKIELPRAKEPEKARSTTVDDLDDPIPF